MKEKYIEHLEYSTDKTNNLIRKGVKYMKRYVSKENIQMTNELMKRCLPSLATRGEWVKTTMRYYRILSERLKIKKKKIVPPKAGQEAEKLDHSHIAGGNVKCKKKKNTH